MRMKSTAKYDRARAHQLVNNRGNECSSRDALRNAGEFEGRERNARGERGATRSERLVEGRCRRRAFTSASTKAGGLASISVQLTFYPLLISELEKGKKGELNRD